MNENGITNFKELGLKKIKYSTVIAIPRINPNSRDLNRVFTLFLSVNLAYKKKSIVLLRHSILENYGHFPIFKKKLSQRLILNCVVLISSSIDALLY